MNTRTILGASIFALAACSVAPGTESEDVRSTAEALIKSCGLDCTDPPPDPPPDPPSTCNGNGVCDATETCDTCPTDCGACPPPPPPPPPVCGDHLCNGTETCSTCSEDCGTCPFVGCGDHFCSVDENADTCPQDCAGLLGCFADDSDRALPTYLGDGFTIQSCRNAARNAGYAFAGLQWHGQCFAGNQVGKRPLPDSSCNTTCNANTREGCGGGWANRIFTTTCGDGACSRYEDAVTCPQDCAGLLGCYRDTDYRALRTYLGNGFTIESCRSAARAQGHAYAGLQFHGECWAGNTVGFEYLPPSACDTVCDADPREGCGGGWANRIFSTSTCGDGVCSDLESQTTCPADCGAPPAPVTAVPGLPEGLTCGLGYVDRSCDLGDLGGDCKDFIIIPSRCEGVNTVVLTPLFNGTYIKGYEVDHYDQAPGYVAIAAHDSGNYTVAGFVSQSLQASAGSADLHASDRFALPQGTACGFRHNRWPANQYSNCMGLEPDTACPAGWSRRRHFDMDSDTQYWVWCEYQDPNHLCTSAECIKNATDRGYAVGLSSNTDSMGWGSYLGHSTKAECPAGLTHTPFYDSGRDSGDGLGFCR